MCDKAILENGETLESVPDCYKINKCVMKNVWKFVPDCYKTQEMCDRAVNTCPYWPLFVKVGPSKNAIFRAFTIFFVFSELLGCNLSC